MQGGHDHDYNLFYTYYYIHTLFAGLQVALAVSNFVLILMGGVMKLT